MSTHITRKLSRGAAVTLALIVAFALTASAQGLQTGVLNGTVRDATGGVLPGVTVTIKSPALQGTRTTVTDENGLFIFRGLPPGRYSVTFELSGMETREERGEVLLGSTTAVNSTMAVAGLTEAVEVTARVTPAPLETPSLGSNLAYETINSLPTGRTLSDIAELSPGLTDNTPNAGQVTISGAFAYDNVFLVDGVDVADNLFGTANNLFIEDAIQETQVLTAGVPAEYGRFSGGVINAITKSGSNVFSGSFRANLTNPSWTAETPFEKEEGIDRESDLSETFEGTFGGPVVRDNLWFFLAGRFAETSDASTFPELGLPVTRTEDNRRFEAKLTGTVFENQTISGTYIRNSTEQTRPSFDFSIDPNTIVNRDLPNDLFVVNYNGVLGSRLFATAQYSQKQFGFRGTGGTSRNIFDSPIISLGSLPGVPSVLHYNAPYFDATDPEDRDNRQISASLSYFLTTEGLGSHDIKGGVEVFTSTNRGGNSQSATDFVFDADYLVDSAGRPVLQNGRFVPVFVPGDTLIENWRATRGAEIDITTTSLFLQDAWQLGQRWSFNAGVRYERVRSEATGGIVGVDTDTFMPRLSVAFDPVGRGEQVLRATYGHYSGKYSEAQFSGNTTVGNPALVLGIYTGPRGQGTDFAPGFDPANYQTIFGRFPMSTVFFDEGLSSPVTREFTAQAGTQLGPRGYLEAAYVQRDTDDFVEDFIDTTTGATTVEEDGLTFGPFDNSVFRNSNLPERRYKALQFTTRYNPLQRLSVTGHWTVQVENEGNFEGEATNQPAISSIVGDYPEVFNEARHFPFGRVNDFQRHKVRLWAIYDFGRRTWGNTTVAAMYRYNSPLTFSLAADSVALTPIQEAIAAAAEYRSSPNGGDQTLFFSTRGSEQFEAAHLIDLSLNVEVPVWRTLRPWVKLDVFNVFGNEALINYNTTINADFSGPVDELGLPTRFIRGPRFGQATTETDFPRARTFQVSLGFRF